MKGYIEILDKQFYDYEVYHRERTICDDEDEKQPSRILLSNNVFKKVREGELPGIDKTLIPNKGSELYVVPPCIYCMNDIRKNYTIKRGCDNGDYNVFSPLSDYYLRYINFNYAVAIPSLKKIFFSIDAEPYTRAMTDWIISIIQTHKLPEDTECFNVVNEYYSLFLTKLPEAYFKILDGTMKKPGVWYKNLCMDTGYPLTLDALLLTYNIGRLPWSNENEEKLKLQLAALNQTEWRGYRGTLSLLFRNLLDTHTYCGTTFSTLRPSSVPKAIKELLGIKYENPTSQEDIDLGASLLSELLGINGVKFCSAGNLLDKLKEFNIHPSTFNKFFNDVVRISPKKYEENN